MSFPNKKQRFSGPSNSIQVKSLENPFDTTNGQPKWPDGLCTYSIGRRHQATSEIQSGDFCLVLFPGSINWCLALRPNISSSGRNEVWANHSTNISFNYAASEKAVEGDTGKDLQWEVGLDGFTEWRGVSYAMHTQLLNTTDKNEGWYEAVRIDKNSFMNMWGIIRGPGSPLGNGNFIRGTPHFHMGGVLPTLALAENMHKSFQWQHEPTFVTGELQDLHNAVFQLNSIKETNEFKKITNVYIPKNGFKVEQISQRDDPVSQEFLQLIKPKKYQLEDPAQTNTKFPDIIEDWAVEQLVSDAFDIIIIRVHGSKGTKLLVHSVANQEFLIAENGQMAQYQTPSDIDIDGLRYYNWNRNTRFKYPFHYLASGGFLGLPKPPYY